MNAITEGSEDKTGYYQTEWALGLETSRVVLVEITITQYKDVFDITTSVSYKSAKNFYFKMKN